MEETGSEKETKFGPMVVANLQIPIPQSRFVVFAIGQKVWVSTEIFDEPISVGAGSFHGGMGVRFLGWLSPYGASDRETEKGGG